MSGTSVPRESFLATCPPPNLGQPSLFPVCPTHHNILLMLPIAVGAFSFWAGEQQEANHSQEQKTCHVLQSPHGTTPAAHSHSQFMKSMGHVLWSPQLFREKGGSDCPQREHQRPTFACWANIVICIWELEEPKITEIPFLSHTSYLLR